MVLIKTKKKTITILLLLVKSHKFTACVYTLFCNTYLSLTDAAVLYVVSIFIFYIELMFFLAAINIEGVNEFFVI